MALIKYSPLINDIRGSAGNATFQRSQAGAVVRNKPVPSVINSQQTVDVRSLLPQVVFAWRGLSSAEQTTWKNFLSYSPDFMRKSPKTMLSAYSLFVKYNCIRLLSDFGIRTSIDFTQPNLAPTRGLFMLYDNVLFIDIGQEITGVDWLYQIRASRPSSSPYSRVLNDFRIIKAYSGPYQIFDCQAAYVAAWGMAPPAGSYIRLSLRFFCSTMPFVYEPIISENYLT